MKIWIIYQHAIPPDLAGGTRHHAMASRLIERGHEVLVMASAFHHFSRSRFRDVGPDGPEMRVEEGVPFLWFRTPSYGDGKLSRIKGWVDFAWQVWKTGKSGRFGRPDVIMSSSPPMPSPLAAQRLASKFKVPHVLEIRDVWPDTLVDIGGVSPRHPAIWAMRRLENHLYRSSELLVSLLPGVEDYLAAKGQPRDKVAYAPNGAMPGQTPRTPLPADEGPFIITYAGHMGYANNLHRVTQAAALLRDRGHGDDILFRIIGDGPCRREIQDHIQAQGLPNVQWLPPVGKDRIHRELAKADAFLMILRKADVFKWGISPNKLADYLVCARPILFGVSQNENVVRTHKLGLEFDPEDAESLARTALDMAALPREERAAMADRGRALAESDYDMDRHLDLLAQRLEALV